MQADVEKIRNDSTLDASAIAQTVAGKEKDNERALQIEMERINLEKDQKIAKAKSEEDRAVTVARTRVQLVAILTPAILLFLLAMGVFLNRMIGESAYIPPNRRREAT